MKAATNILASSSESVVGTSCSSCTDIPAIRSTNDAKVSSLVALLESSASRGNSLTTLQRVFEHILQRDADDDESGRLELLVALLPQLASIASEVKEHQPTQPEPSSSSQKTKTALLLASILLHLLPDEEEEEGTLCLFTPTTANQLRTCLQLGCLPFAVLSTDVRGEDNHTTIQQQRGREERQLAIVLLSIFSLSIPLFRSAPDDDDDSFSTEWMLSATLTLVQAHGLAAADKEMQDEPSRTIMAAFFTDHVNVLVLGCSIWGRLILTDQQGDEHDENTPRGRPACQRRRRRNEDETNGNTTLSILHCLLDNIIAAKQLVTSSSPDFTVGSSSSSFCCWSLLQQLVGSPQAAHELLQQALVWKGYHHSPDGEGAARGSCWVYGTAAAAA